MLPSSSHFLSNSPKNLLRVFHYLFTDLVQERGQECGTGLQLQWATLWSGTELVTDPLAQLPWGDPRGERQGELHGCTMTAGVGREISHVLPLLFTLTHVLSHPGSSRAHPRAGWGQREGKGGHRLAKPVKTRETLPFLQGGSCSPGHRVSSSHHWVQQDPDFHCKQQCLCPAPVCAQLLSVPSSCLGLPRVPIWPGWGMYLVSEGPCKSHQLQGNLDLSLGVFVKYSTRPAPQQSVFSVRGKHGGRTEQSLEAMTNVQVFVWLRYPRDWRNL